MSFLELPMRSRDVLPAERLVKICPWLWAFQKHWSTGVHSVTGSLHCPTAEMFREELTEASDRHTDIYFMCTVKARARECSDAIEIPKLSISKTRENGIGWDDLPNPDSDGRTLGERIIGAIPSWYLYTIDEIHELVNLNQLVVDQIVFRTEGFVERTEHYFIFEDFFQEKASKPRHVNLLGMVLESAGDFKPKLQREREAATVS